MAEVFIKDHYQIFLADYFINIRQRTTQFEQFDYILTKGDH
jgi:hypothetical protein